jgi:hypothetical protein
MVWIKCKTGEFLDPKKIRSIRVSPCHGSAGEVEIFAEYGHDHFLLFRTTVSSLQKLGIRNNKEKFQMILDNLSKKHELSQCISYDDIFTMILEDRDESGRDPESGS